MPIYLSEYATDLVGTLTLASDGAALVGCWFEHDRHPGYGVGGEQALRTLPRKDDLPVFEQARSWLGRYCAGAAPLPSELPLAPRGTAFQQCVWRVLAEIPYGETVTYGDVARRLEVAMGARTSARAVGGAVGRNPLCVIVPCHRVVGAGGNLTGFGGGIPAKVRLLEHEGVDLARLYVPRRGTAL